MLKKIVSTFWLVLLGILLLVIASSCQADTPAPVNDNMPEEGDVQDVEVEEPEPTPEPTSEPTPEPTPLPDQTDFHASWEGGNHNIYDLYHGPNTWCARCHSPQNWDPEATIGTPPNCFSCKFPTDEEVRISDGNDLISEEDWVGINCETCHHVDENGIASAEIAWLNPISGEYQGVNTSTELCEKCHVTTTGNSFGSAVDHNITLGGSAHLNYGGFLGDVPPPQYCSDCHDPHSTQPKRCADCHDVANLGTHIKGNNFHLAKVSCMACHDAEGYDVGPHPTNPENELWTTQVTEMGRSGPSTSTVISHSIKYEVACNRCHFEENPWELPVLTEDGEIPVPEESDQG